MKKSRSEAAETRRRIVEKASAEFRRSGIHSTGLCEVMAAAGLTHGGFYCHFDSKGQLIAEACEVGTESVVQMAEAALRRGMGRSGLDAIAGSYLSASHRDDRSGGCLFAGLGSELVRADEAARQAASTGFLKLVDVVARQYEGLNPATARSRALVAVVTMIGAVTMARMVVDYKVSDDILRSSLRHLRTT